MRRKHIKILGVWHWYALIPVNIPGIPSKFAHATIFAFPLWTEKTKDLDNKLNHVRSCNKTGLIGTASELNSLMSMYGVRDINGPHSQGKRASI
jgi:hypothetical protein